MRSRRLLAYEKKKKKKKREALLVYRRDHRPAMAGAGLSPSPPFKKKGGKRGRGSFPHSSPSLHANVSWKESRKRVGESVPSKFQSRRPLGEGGGREKEIPVITEPCHGEGKRRKSSSRLLSR